MKKFAILTFAAFLAVGLISCQSDSNDGSDAAAAGDDAPSATTTTPDQPQVTPTEDAGPALPPTTVEFSEMKHDFGKIKQGDVVEHTFKFTNTGDKPLKVAKVKPSCGCTTPDWTKEEVAPGADGIIKVEFDSKGKKGVQNKSVTVTLNTEKKQEVLSFSGEVIAPEGDAAPAQ